MVSNRGIKLESMFKPKLPNKVSYKSNNLTSRYITVRLYLSNNRGISKIPLLDGYLLDEETRE